MCSWKNKNANLHRVHVVGRLNLVSMTPDSPSAGAQLSPHLPAIFGFLAALKYQLPEVAASAKKLSVLDACWLQGCSLGIFSR